VFLLGARDVSELCALLEVSPSKKKGQNFVTDPGTVRRIAAAAGISPGDTVVEIGPGLGSLTLALLELGCKVIAIEIDQRLAAALPVTVAQHGANSADLCVMTQDALEIAGESDLEIPAGWAAPHRLVANLPYNVATPLLLHFLEVLPNLESALVMVQAEVADRWVAGVADGAYGAPSVKLAWWGRTKRAFKVGRNVFYPVPNVDSTVVEFRRLEVRQRLREDLKLDLENLTDEAIETLRQEVFAAVNAAFSQRRKTLRQSLAGYAGSPDAAAVLLESAGIIPGLRAERLSVTDFTKIAAAKLYGTNDTK
jgi:hypothetical protein